MIIDKTINKRIKEVVDVNPKIPFKNITDKLLVSFIPMKNVEAETGNIDLSIKREYSEVKKGFTGFVNGDILFAKITPCIENGKIAIANELENTIGFGSTEFHILRCKEEIINKYLYYFLIRLAFRKEAQSKMTGGVGQKRVPRAFLENSLIPIPSIKAQNKIVKKIEELFSELEKGVESLNKVKEQLKIYRQSVFNQMCPLNELVKADRKFKNWKLVTLENIIDEPKYGTSKKCGYEIKGTGVLRIPNISDNYINDSDMKYAEFDKSEVGALTLNSGDILMIRSNGSIDIVGRSAIISERETMYLFAGYLIRIRPKSHKVIPKFLLYSLSSRFLRNQIELKAKSTSGVNNINSKEIKSLKLYLPPIAEQKSILNLVEKRLELCSRIEKKISEVIVKTESLRQSILKQAFEGTLIR